MEAEPCRNCGASVAEAYCGQCGQRRHRRLELADLAREAWDSVASFDGRLARTFRDLTLRPGAAMRAFIDGARRRYVGPVGWFLSAIALQFVLADALEVRLSEVAQGGKPRLVATGPAEAEVAAVFQTLLFDHLRQFMVLTTPVFAVLLGLAFRKARLSYAETLVFALYTAGQAALLFGVPGVAASKLWASAYGVLNAASALYHAAAAIGFYRLPWWSTLLRLALAFALWMAFLAVGSVAVFLAAVWIAGGI